MVFPGCDPDSSNQRENCPECFVQVSEKDPRYFQLSDGSPYIPIGLNMIAPNTAPSLGMDRMEEWMRLLSENGGNFIRIWLGARYWNPEQKAAGLFDNEAAERIDSLFMLARKYDIRLKMCLESFRSIHPDNVGIKGRFPLTMYHTSKGGPFDSMEEYINTDRGKAHFKKKLDWFQERYGSDPIIFGWELWNEMDAIVADGWESWTEEMLEELDARFPENLVMQSLGSYDRIRKREMYRRVISMPGNEVAQVHRYLDLGAEWEICHAPMDLLAADAVREMVAFNPGKPILLAETGGVEPSHTGPIRYYKLDTMGMILHDILFVPFFSGAAGPGHTWHWSQYVAENALWYHFDRFAQAVDGIDPTEEQFEPLMLEQDSLRAYVLRGKRTIMVWLRDEQNTWKSELEEGIAPRLFYGVELDLARFGLGFSEKRVEIFDPWRNSWEEGRVRDQKIMLPEFSRSLVIRAKSN
jgi:hypothetical protein